MSSVGIYLYSSVTFPRGVHVWQLQGSQTNNKSAQGSRGMCPKRESTKQKPYHLLVTSPQKSHASLLPPAWVGAGTDPHRGPKARNTDITPPPHPPTPILH